MYSGLRLRRRLRFSSSSSSNSSGLRLGVNGNYISGSSHESARSFSSEEAFLPCPLIHFSRTEGGNGNGCFECNYCGQLIDCASNVDGDSVLWDHLEIDCGEYENRVVDDRQNISSFKTEECESDCGSNIAKGEEACLDACAKMIVLEELPFKYVEQIGFRLFWSENIPDFSPPSHFTMAKEVYRLYLRERGLLKSMFSSNKQRVCLSIDYWTSIHDIDYMVLTAHYIDDEWRLQKKMLNFYVIPDHKGETIGETVLLCLRDWDIGIERVFTITLDDVSANVAGINYMKEQFKSQAVDRMVLKGELLHLQCFTHTVNSIVNEYFKDIYDDDSIVSIRKAIYYVRFSSEHLKKFKKCMKHEKIKCESLVDLDVPNRLKSTYLMLVGALELQKAFKRLEEEDGDFVIYLLENESWGRIMGPPSKDDWERARAIVRLLKIFYDVIMKFTTPLSVTSNIYFQEIWSIQVELTQLSKSGDPLIGTMATSIKKKFDEHWGSIDSIHKVLIISYVLDPRYKLNHTTFDLEEIYGDSEVENLTKSTKEVLFHLYDVYSAMDTSHDVQSSNGMDVDTQKNKHNLSAEVKDEVDRYLMETNEDPSNDQFDTLDWWRLNATRYPILSCIARDVLAIPVTTVASESAFSSERRMLNEFQSAMDWKMVQALMCTKDWLQSVESDGDE